MKTKIIGLFIFFILAGLFGMGLRRQVKRVLPRVGEVKIVGGVYTPFLLLDSALYFLKSWDESIDSVFAKSSSEKARFELVFANKRLLEMEKLSRESDFSFVLNLTTSFSESLKRSVDYTREALTKKEDTESLIWLFQESFVDQQKIFKIILDRLPQNEKDKVLEIQQQSTKEINNFLRETYNINP